MATPPLDPGLKTIDRHERADANLWPLRHRSLANCPDKAGNLLIHRARPIGITACGYRDTGRGPGSLSQSIPPAISGARVLRGSLWGGGDMNAFDVESFVAEMDRMGVKLTAVPLADGTVRVNRWRTMQAVEHGHRIDHLWGLQVGHDRARIDSLAAHLMKRAA
jgi:hypothetical protein